MSAVLAVLSSLLWGTSDFLGGTASRRLPAVTVVALSQTSALVVLLPLLLVWGVRPSALGLGLLAGLAGSLGVASFYGALAGGTMGIVAPIASAGAVVPVLVGLTRGEHPGTWRLVAIGVVLLGVALASGVELSGGAPPGPLLLAVVSAVCFGTVMTLIARGSQGPAGAVVTMLFALRLAGVATMAPVVLVRGPGRGWRALLPLLVVIGAVDAGANACFAFAARGGLLSIVGVLGSLYPVVTVLLARRVHHERLAPLQVAGVVATLSGVVLLST